MSIRNNESKTYKTAFALNTYLFSLILSLLLLLSCSKDYNPDLRGKWQLRTIQKNAITTSVDTIFYNFDNYVFVMQNRLSSTKGVSVFGEFSQHHDSLKFSFPDSKFGSRSNLLEFFQWSDTTRIYVIRELNSNVLTLKYDNQILAFRKY